MSTTLPLFWHLSSASKKERLDASVKLVGALEHFQAQFVPKDSPEPRTSGSDEEDEDDEEGFMKSDGLDALNAQDVSYSIRRLVRGLASPRESSRLGFAVALTELLSRIDTVTCSQIVTFIVDGTKTQGSMTGAEERDVLFARLFGLTAVIKSGLIVRTSALAKSAAPASALSSYEETVIGLVALGETKSWLRESAWWTIALAIDALVESDVSWKGDAINSTLHQLFVENKPWSPEKVALALKLQNLYPARDWKQLLSPSFKNPDLLSAANLQVVARILKETTIDEDNKDVTTAAPGFWKPQLHFVWDIILDCLLPGPNTTSSVKGSFQEFYRVAVDESLFSATSSKERKYWGFQVFQKALPRVTQNNMPMLFTKNFMRSWINQLASRERYLHKIARQAVTEVEAFVQSNPHMGLALILQLTGVNGSRQFDKLTKTKTVENILTSMDVSGIKSYIDYLLEQVDEHETAEEIDVRATNARRAWIIEQLCALIRNGAIPKDDEWIQTILDWLLLNGIFLVKKKSDKSSFRGLRSVPKPALSDELRQNCRTRLLSCLGDLNAQSIVIRRDEKLSKATGVASDEEFWVSKVLASVEQLEKDTKHVSLLVDIPEEVRALCAKAKGTVARLKNITDERTDAAKGTELLLLATTLQQYCAGDGEDIDTEALEASIDGAARMFPEGKKAKTKKPRKSVDEDAEPLPEPVDVLVDTIIGFLEKSTAYMRTVGNQVFALLSSSVQESTIDLIISQLERRDPAELAEDDEEDSNDEMDDGEADEDEESDEENEERGEESGGDSNDEEADEELRSKIEEALRVNGIEAATGDSDEEDDELMDDDQMMAVDEQLAAVFRSRANEKKSGKVDVQREATHFKNRVLDLIETFFRKNSTSPLIIKLIAPILELITGTGTDERQLSDKAKGILRSKIAKAKDVPTGVDVEQVKTILDDLHVRARKVHSSDLLAALSQCSVYLSRALLLAGAEDAVVQAYRQSLADFITRKNSALNTNFFQELIRRCPASGWQLRGDLIDLVDKGVNVFRQSQAFQLVETLVIQFPAMDDRAVEIVEFMTLLRKALLYFATKACDDKVILTSAQMKDLFKLTLVAIKQTQRVGDTPATTQEVWQSESWKTLRGQLQASARFKNSSALQKMCARIESMTSATPKPPKKHKKDGSVPVAAKRKAEEEASGTEEIVETKKTKRKRVKKDRS